MYNNNNNNNNRWGGAVGASAVTKEGRTTGRDGRTDGVAEIMRYVRSSDVVMSACNSHRSSATAVSVTV